MIRRRAVQAAMAALLCLILGFWAASHVALAAQCPPPPGERAPKSRDCRPFIISPRGYYPTEGGTFTVWSGSELPCVTQLPGFAYLCAGGETAPQIPNAGHAIFRVSGRSPEDPGGVNIVVSASISSTPGAPEMEPSLHADAYISLPPHTVLLRFDPTTWSFIRVRDGRIRATGLYKIVRKGTSPLPLPALPSLPATLPATGGSPFGAMLALAIAVILAGLALARGQPRWRGPGIAARERLGVAVLTCGVLLAALTGLAYAYAATRPALHEFGTLADVVGPGPRSHLATSPPTRVDVPRLGIDTRVMALGIAQGTWQVPAFAAGYLSHGIASGGSNLIITGHDDRDGAVFRRLGEVQAGDTIQVYQGGRLYRYAVTAMAIVPATRTDVLRATRDAMLTLITCTPYLIDTERIVVRARLLP